MERNSSANKLSTDLLDCLAAAANLIANSNPSEYKAFKRSSDSIPLLLALSGGSDSTALLLALSKVAPNFGFRLLSCHINHGLRAEESEKDAHFCQRICENLNIECEIIKICSTEITKTKHMHASEETLRQLRYARLTNFARSKNISYLITAHTLDDQVETVLFRLFRGTALSGLKGIENYRKLENNLYLLRPLLKLSKIQCQKFLESEGFAFRHDLSNLNDIYSRNYIRLKVLPVILERFPDLSLHLDSLTEIAHAEDSYMDQTAHLLFARFHSEKPNDWSIKLFKEQPLALQRRVLTHALKNRDIEVSFKRIDEIISLAITELPLAPGSFYLNLNKHWRIKRSEHELSWQELSEKTNNYHFEPQLIKIPGINLVPEINSELIIETYQTNLDQIPIAANPLQLSLDGQSILADLSKIKPPLILRQRYPGDKIQPLGMSQIVKLKKYLHTHKNSKIHALYPQILLADQNEVLWLPGIGMSEKIKVIHKPSHILKWRQVRTDRS